MKKRFFGLPTDPGSVSGMGFGLRHDGAASVKTGKAATVENSQPPGTELPPSPG